MDADAWRRIARIEARYRLPPEVAYFLPNFVAAPVGTVVVPVGIGKPSQLFVIPS